MGTRLQKDTKRSGIRMVVDLGTAVARACFSLTPLDPAKVEGWTVSVEIAIVKQTVEGIYGLSEC